MAAHGLGRPDQEAVVAGDPAVITWLQLRFGGTVTSAVLSPAALRRQAMALPDPAPVPAIVARPTQRAADGWTTSIPSRSTP